MSCTSRIENRDNWSIFWEKPVVALIPSHNNILVVFRDFIQKATRFYFDFQVFWGKSHAYKIDLPRLFKKASFKKTKSNLIPLELLIEEMIIAWK